MSCNKQGMDIGGILKSLFFFLWVFLLLLSCTVCFGVEKFVVYLVNHKCMEFVVDY